VAVALAGVLVVTLAPALLTLFGRGVFWVPRFLDRILPHLDIEGGAGAGADPGAELATRPADEDP
jgi:RND superfamily putative drug exporter